MSKRSPQVLGRAELVECAKAIAVMVTRFKPTDIGRFYTTVDIAENLCQLPQGQLSTFHVEIDTLKKALANQTLKLALSTILPGRFEYMRYGTRHDIITTGPNSFPKGYQLKFIFLVDDPVDLRKEIFNLRDSLVNYCNQQETQLTTAVKKREEEIETVESSDFVTALIATTSLPSASSTATENKRK
jgi:hypothetical protein